MKLLNEVSGFSGLFGQNQFAQACGLQAVSRTIVLDFHRFLSAQDVGTVHTAGADACGVRA
jgi:hypothetical protein